MEPGQRWQMAYRPFCLTREEASVLRVKLKNRDRVRMQIPGASAIGLSRYQDDDPVADTRSLVREFRSVRVAVSSLVTGLSLEAAHLGVPTVAYFPENPLLPGKHSRLMLNRSGRVTGLESLPVAKSISELEETLVYLMQNPQARVRIVRETQELWPASGKEFSRCLDKAVFSRREVVP